MGKHEERLEAWRKLLSAAKPKDWQWEPPSVPDQIDEVSPIKPPKETIGLLCAVADLLPEDEQSVLYLYFEGRRASEISPHLPDGEGNELVAKLVLDRALQRIAETLMALRYVKVSKEEVLGFLKWIRDNHIAVAGLIIH